MAGCSKEACKSFLHQNALVFATVLGVIVGISLGIGMREANLSNLEITYFSLPGNILLRMLKMMILPLIVCSLITGNFNLKL